LLKKWKNSKQINKQFLIIFIVWMSTLTQAGKISDIDPRELIIKLPRSTQLGKIRQALPGYELSHPLMKSGGKDGTLYLLKIPPATRIDEAYYQLRRDGWEIYYNHYLAAQTTIPNDPFYVLQWHFETMGVVPVWDYFTGSGEHPVYILDSGVDYRHPDLANALWRNPGEIAFNNIDDDNNGYVDDTIGYDFVTIDPSQTNNGDGYPPDNDPIDCAAHGTAVAGAVAGVANNGIGIAASNWEGRYYPVRIGYAPPSGIGVTAKESDAVAGFDYALQMGAKIINFSYGGISPTPALEYIIREAWERGVLVFCSAGNENNYVKYYPAAYPEAIAITGINNQNQNQTSVYGPWVDLCAPSSQYTTLPGGGLTGSYGYVGGTSISSPIAASVASLLWDYLPHLPGPAILTLLEQSSASVDALNPYIPAYSLGYGNMLLDRAFRFSTDAPLIILDSIVWEPARQSLAPGESATLQIFLTNAGDTLSGGQLAIGSLTDPLEITPAAVEIPLIEPMGHWQSSFCEIAVPETCPFETITQLALNLYHQDSLLFHYQYSMETPLNPLFRTYSTHRLSCAFSSSGLIGHNENTSNTQKYHDYAAYQLGDGLSYNEAFGLLYSGAFCFTADNYPLVDGTVRNNPTTLSDWRILSLFHDSVDNSGNTMATAHYSFSWQDGAVSVTQTVKAPRDSSFMLVDYELTHTYANPLQHPRVAFMLDLDLIDSGANLAYYDTTNHFLIQSYTHPANTIYAGQTFLEGSGIQAAAITNFYSITDTATQRNLFDSTVIHNGEGDYYTILSATNEGKAEWAGETEPLHFTWLLTIADDSAALRQNLQSARNWQKTVAISESAVNTRKLICRAYPNPASDIVTINWHNPSQTQPIINLYNIMGQRIPCNPPKSNIASAQIDIRHLPAGIYFFVLKFPQETLTHKILVIH